MKQNEIARITPIFDPLTGKKITSYEEEMEARDKIDRLARKLQVTRKR